MNACGIHESQLNRIQHALYRNREQAGIIPETIPDVLEQSAVLLPIGCKESGANRGEELCLILNKRSRKVRQAGDLCFPGGGISPWLDGFLGKLAVFAPFTLNQWTFWKTLRRDFPGKARQVAILYAASLRESFEEMRLNPFGVRFLGMLPPKQLVIRNRHIFPMVGWIPRQKKFFPNWEVDEIVHIPFRNLLDPEHYVLCDLSLAGDRIIPKTGLPLRHPGYLHQEKDNTLLLWGATYRIVMDFLNLALGFSPPEPETLPLIEWRLDENYFNGMPPA